MQFTTKPVLGGDQKSPVRHTNTMSPLNRTFLQGKTVSGKFQDGNCSFTLAGTNSYFNNRMNSSGKI